MPDADRSLEALVFGAIAGATAMYLLDPDRGRRRRALVRDKVQSSSRRASRAAATFVRDARWRLQGLAVQARQIGRGTGVTDDLQLIERVRSRIGRVVRNPHAIHVGALAGRITVSGPVLEDEAAALLAAARAVPGVHEVEDRLVLHADASSVPALQGARRRAFRASRRLSPAARGALTIGAAVLALRSVGIAPVALGALALAMLNGARTHGNTRDAITPMDAAHPTR